MIQPNSCSGKSISGLSRTLDRGAKSFDSGERSGSERSSHECLALFEMDITPKFSGNEQSVVSEAAEVNRL